MPRGKRSKYRHVRIRDPRYLRKTGRTKFRAVKAGRKRLVLAFPGGRRRRGSGKLQAILYPKNPRGVKVYERIEKIIARKGSDHKCDAACRRADHTYEHRFSGKAGVYGMPDGSIAIRG